jgi:hypothetical protein
MGGSKLSTRGFIPCIVGIKPSQSTLLNHSLKVLLPDHRVFSELFLTFHKNLATKTHAKSPITSMPSPLRSFSVKEGISTSHAQNRRRRSTPSRKVDDLPTSHKDSKTPAHRDTSLSFTQVTTPCSHALPRASLALHLTKSVLNLRI